MRILIEGENYEDYYAKVHEAYRTGLKAVCDARCYGKGYAEYDENITSFVDAKEAVFGNDEIDLILLTDCWDPRHLEAGFKYSDLEKLNCKKAIMLCDFWSEADCQFDKYCDFINRWDIDFIFSYFRAPFHMWESHEIWKKLIWYPPSFDPHIFNDWGKQKKWSIGNLNAGVDTYSSFYPERSTVHEILSNTEGIKYLTKKHPGTGILPKGTRLIGKDFSETINQCKCFFTSGNLKYKNSSPKYIEILASKSCLFAYEPMDSELIGLVDGQNYICVDERNIREKLLWYLNNENELARVTDEGYRFVMKKYNCYAVSMNLVLEVRKRIEG